LLAYLIALESRMRPRFPLSFGPGLALAVVVMLATAPAASVARDGAASDGPVTVYSGRSESLVGPLFEQFTQATGIEVQARYADTAELAALLLEEGQRSPADVFFAQDAGALGVVADAGLLDELDATVLERVDARFRDPDGRWVGVSGRARTAAFSTDLELELPTSILGFTDPQWSGRLGWAPANGSFQAFVTALREIEGEDVARSWLEGIIANGAVAYPKNTAAVEGVAVGEVDVVFVNHYYLLRLLEENGPDYPVAQVFFEAGDAGALINVAGVGRLATSDAPESTEALVEFLLGAQAQGYFSTETFEFPLTTGTMADPRLPDLASIDSPDLHLSQLADLPGTVSLLREVGAID
jgi:iron(III) transport system substrate-binding protein